jgi:integrase
MAQIKDAYTRVLLGRFGRFCSAHNLEPSDISDAVADRYLQSLENELRVAKPRNTHRETARLWNRLARSMDSWPQVLLMVPSYSRKYVLAWEAFHPALVSDVESFLSKQATLVRSLSAPIRALKPSSITTYRDRLRRFASCLILTGTDVSQLRSLADLVELKAVERGLRYLAQERKARPLAAAVGTLLATIARDHVGRPEEDVIKIAHIAARLRAKRNGLSSKVRDRLRPLKHEANLARLFLFPTALTRSLMRQPETRLGDAQLFQRALALALLTVCPLRIGALCSISLDRHLSWSAGPMKGDVIIEFAPGELKGDEPGSFPIPRDVANLIRVYCIRFRPLLDPRGSPYLFCGRDPVRARDKGGFSMALTQLIFERLGLWVNPHLFRHIVHLIVLRRFPGAYAMIARVLTHRSIATTIRNYSQFDAEISMRAYQRLVEDVRAGGTHERSAEAAVVAYALDRERPGHVRC